MTTSSGFIKASDHQVQDFIEDKERDWTNPYYFIFAADPQPGVIDTFQNGDGSKWKAEMELCESTVAAINLLSPRPKFVLIGGDIVNALPGTEHRVQQVIDIKQVFSKLSPEIPLLAISGNHDVGNIPNNQSMDEYRREFGDEYYSFWVGGVFFIALNSQCFFNCSETAELCSEQSAWLEQQLQSAKTNKCQHVIVFMHIPLFTESPDEEDGYFNIRRELRFDLLEKFAEAGVKKVFSGHTHRKTGGVWTKTNADGSISKVEVVVCTSLGAQLGGGQPGLYIVKVDPDKITPCFYHLGEIPRSVALP